MAFPPGPSLYPLTPSAIQAQNAWQPDPPQPQGPQRLTPPQQYVSTNPPFPGPHLNRAVMVAWIPPPPDPTFAKNAQPLQKARLTPPLSGPAVQDPPRIGARVPVAVLSSWLPHAPQPVTSRLKTPASAPIPSNPPVTGGRGLPAPILVAWNQSQFQTPSAPTSILIPFWLVANTPSGSGPVGIAPRPATPPVTGPAPTTPAANTLVTNLFQLFNDIVEGRNQTFCDFDLYTVTLFNGAVLRFTTADFDVAALGFTYSSGGVRIDQAQSKVQAHWKIGLDVDTWTVVFMPRPFDPITGAAFPDLVGSVPFIQAAHGGFFDNADFQVDRAYFTSMPTWPMPPKGAVPVGTKTIFAGKVAAIDVTDLVTVFTVNDYRDLLSISMPRHFYQGQCRHVLFDIGCNADGNMQRGSFARNWTAQAGTTQNNIVATGIANPPGSGTYTLGTVIMTSGQNNGFQRTIANWDGTNMRLVAPFPFTINVGDTFSAAAGCDLQLGTCAAFNNVLNFGGEPYIPAPETVT